MGSDRKQSYEEAKGDIEWQAWFERPIKRLMEIGVPFVCAAGNHGDEPNRQNIDTVPGVLQDSETPIIVVGSAEYDGTRSDFSQGGDQLTIYAPGREVVVQSMTDFQSSIKSGTSYGKFSKRNLALNGVVKTCADLLNSCTTSGRPHCNIPGL
jgi:hypothetical protein